MRLTGRQIEELQNAILAAYPDREELRIDIFVGMDINLTDIVSDSTDKIRVFKLIEQFIAKEKLGEFVNLIFSKRRKNIVFEKYQKLIQAKETEALANLINAQVEEENDGNHRESDLLREQAEQKDKELAQKDHRPQQFNDYIRQIDFDEAKGIFDSILKKYGKKEAPVLLLMHESEPKKGDLYLQHIINHLQPSNPNFQGYSKTDFKTYSIGHSSDIVIEDEKGLLNRLATWFGVKEKDAQETDKIITKIVDSIVSGTVLLFHFNNWNQLANRCQTCLWLVENFWTPLVTKVSNLCKEQEYYNVKIILMIDSPGELDKEIFDLPCVCSPKTTSIRQIQQNQVIKVPLRNWKKEEVKHWLDTYIPMKDKEERERRAQRIYSETAKGIPKLAYDSLWREYKRK
jgi:hypothetical protein